jgi:hypothetical protein
MMEEAAVRYAMVLVSCLVSSWHVWLLVAEEDTLPLFNRRPQSERGKCGEDLSEARQRRHSLVLLFYREAPVWKHCSDVAHYQSPLLSPQTRFCHLEKPRSGLIRPPSTMPTPRPQPLRPVQQMVLAYHSTATRNAVSGLKSSVHLFLRNQPKAPEKLPRKQLPRMLKRNWRAPRVNYA